MSDEPQRRKRSILVFQHVPYEPLGTLDPLLRRRRIRVRYVNFGRAPHARPDLTGYDGVIVLGGPMNVDEADRHPHLHTELELLREALDRDLPVLGICLGAQLLARALGAEVTRNPVKELGWHDLSLTAAGRADPVLAELADMPRIFQWHGDTFALPQGAELLASSPACAHQAFRWRQRAYGLQFHLEIDRGLVARWLQVHREELAQLQGIVDAEQILRETDARIAQSMAVSERLFGRLLDLFGCQEREPAIAVAGRSARGKRFGSDH
jgi:GMP synthase (glutamine-hydrolysing)